MKYYRPAVLAMFYNQPEKYEIQTDEFEGSVCIRSTYYAKYGENASDVIYLKVDFGFRACRNGDWAIAAYAPDLNQASSDERQLWLGFEIGNEEEFSDSEEHDARFQKWWSRYIMGNWDVEDGPIAKLDYIVQQINAVAQCVVNAPLLSVNDLRRLCFPSAQNTHRYEDAHAEVYKLMIDGLNKDAIMGIGRQLGIDIKAGDKRTLDALEMLFPEESVRTAVRGPLNLVSEQRRRASHKERPPAESYAAFEAFEQDLKALIRSIETIRDNLAERLNVDTERCEKRASAMRNLPKFDESRPTQPNYAIYRAMNIAGKQVKEVRTGELVTVQGRPEMEAIVLEFSDGSMLSIEPATNISQVLKDDGPIDPQDLHITLHVNFVPPMLPFREDVDVQACAVAGEQTKKIV
jgi:hypothetical protein